MYSTIFSKEAQPCITPIDYQVAGIKIRDKTDQKVGVIYLARRSQAENHAYFGFQVNDKAIYHHRTHNPFVLVDNEKITFKMSKGFLKIVEIDQQGKNIFYVDIQRTFKDGYLVTKIPSQPSLSEGIAQTRFLPSLSEGVVKTRFLPFSQDPLYEVLYVDTKSDFKAVTQTLPQPSLPAKSAKEKCTHLLEDPTKTVLVILENQKGIGALVWDKDSESHELYLAANKEDKVSQVTRSSINILLFKDGQGSAKVISKADRKKIFEYYPVEHYDNNYNCVQGYFLLGEKAALIHEAVEED